MLHAVLPYAQVQATEKNHNQIYTIYFLALLAEKFNLPSPKTSFPALYATCKFFSIQPLFYQIDKSVFHHWDEDFFIKKIGESKKNASFFITEMMQKNTSFNYVPLKAEKVMSRNNATI